MTPLALFATLLTLATVFGIINNRTLRLPNTIGVLLISLLASLAMLGLDAAIPDYGLKHLAQSALGRIDLPRTLLDGVLSLLLFAGALQVDVRQLWERKLAVLALALLGTLLAVGLFAGGIWFVFALIGLPVALIWCVVLGAILAPTDPVSVVGMLRRVGLPGPLQAVFAGESLFNDGVGVVVFGVALGVASGDGSVLGGTEIVGRFLLEAVGGGLLGLAVGWIALQLLRVVDDPHLELLISLALATGTFSLADGFAMSGPIATVVAGLGMGSRTSIDALSPDSHRDLMIFWSLVDEILNALLFLLIGFEVVAVAFHVSVVLAALAAIPLSLAVRALSVFLSTLPVHLRKPSRGRALVILTWGGLRGGISVALALALPASPERPALLAVCYGVVLFTIVVQGLTIERVARRFYRKEDHRPALDPLKTQP